MATGKEEILATAIQLERDGRKFYLDAAAKVTNPLARQMLESLADDEVKHIEWIEPIDPGSSSASSINKGFYERMKGIFADAPSDVRQAVAASDDDIQPLRLAIEMEEKAEAAYTAWGKETDQEDVRHLCTVLADTERFHRQVLQNTINYLKEPSEWFMQEENWNFEG
jgi:rubrerythrin